MVVNRLCVLFVFISAFTFHSIAQPSGIVRLLSHYVPPNGGSYIAGCWGWTDTTTGREYALLGSSCGTSIVEITNGSSPIERSFIPGVCSSWREIQVHQNYAYVVSEGGGGTQIIDLSYLPDSAHLVKNFNYSSGANNIVRSHSLHIRDGYLYLNGCANWSPGGIVIFSLADPINPAFQSVYTREYVHDCFVRNDTIYAAGIYGVGVDIINATNKTSPQHLYTIAYAGAGTHNTATTSDGKYVLSTDEIGSAGYTLKIWDRQSPPSFPKVAEYFGSPTAIVHNVFVKGNLAFMSYYTKGLKIIDVTNPTSPVEIGGYDTYPADDHQGYTGAWSTYPFFPSGKIIIGDMETGLYVVDMDTAAPGNASSFAAYSDFLTPTSIQLSWVDPTATVGGSQLSNFKIHLYRNGSYIAEVDSGIQNYTDNGLTQHQLYTYIALTVVSTDSSGGVSSSAYAGGHAVPKSPTGFTALSAVGGVRLSWTNPSRQLDNTPLNDLAAIRVYRDGGFLKDIAQTLSDTGQARTSFDSIAGYHSYYLQAVDNEIPTHVSSATSTITVYGNVYLNYVEGFESNLGQIYRTGTWDTTSSITHSGTRSFTDSRIGTYPPGLTTVFQTPPVILGSNPVLQFSHIAIIAFGDIGYVEISKNAGTSFTVLKPYNLTMRSGWQDSIANATDWYTDVFQLNAYANDTVIVRFRLVTNGTINTDGWYIDDILLGNPATPVTTTQSLVESWNMISLPLIVTDGKRTTLYPDATSQLYLFNGSSYVPTDSLKPGEGYWLKFPASSSATMTGVSSLRDTIDVHPRWNLIGSLSGKIPISAIKSAPSGIVTSNYFSYNGSYSIATALDPGNAYWVKTSQTGTLILSAFQNGASPLELPKEETEAQFNTITFTDADSHKQTLYYVSRLEGSISLSQYEMPPIPPVEAFDVRFRSQRMLESGSATGNNSFPIMLQAVRYPLTITWNANDRPMASALIIDGNTQSLTTPGTAIIENRISAITLQILTRETSSIPKEFTLNQNYPNPFNPTTDIRYQISNFSFVTISIYDVLGREISTLVHREHEPGNYSVMWNAGNTPSGMYYARMTATNTTGSRVYTGMQKMMLMK